MAEQRFLIFKINNEEYGFDIERVEGIENDIDIVPMPNRPEDVLGIINIRGDVIPVISLRSKFGYREETSALTRLIITSIDKEKVAFKVDSVVEIVDIIENELHRMPDVVINDDNEYVNKVCRIDKRLIIIINLDRILEKEQISAISSMIKEN